MTPAEALVETLVAEGVNTVFGIVGSAYMDALDLFPAAGIRFVSVAHEQAAAHAADGLARATGRPQACIAQNGPGAANFVSAITAAFWAHSPVVAITPETGSMGIGTGGFQELDQMPWFAVCTKYQVRVNRPERMAELARRCFYIAKAEHGPTQLNIPRDYFYGEIEAEIYRSPEVAHGAGSADQLEQAARMLAGAERPAILAGGGVVSAEAVEQVRTLAEHLSAPVINTYLHNDSFPWRTHPLGMGPIGYCGSKAAMRTLAQADVVLALGTRLGPFGTLPQYDIDYWPKDAKVIQVDIDHRQLGLSRRVDLGVAGDAREFAVQVLARLGQRGEVPARGERLAELAAAKETWQRELDGWSKEPSARMHPRAFLRELSMAMPRDAIVTTDVGNTCSMSNSYFGGRDPRGFMPALSWGNCGIAYGVAMGAKIGAPARSVFALQGDGAWGISGLSEVMTAAREEIPVIAVVFNNDQWGAEKKNQIDYYDNRFVGANLTNPDFARLARDMGAEGFRVERAQDVAGVVDAALKAGKPVVIDAIIEGAAEVLAEPFRRDALHPPVRLLEKYRHLNAK
jgi:sulfoacetaldehyde acetyltransferase